MEKPKGVTGCVLRGRRWHYKRRLRPPISEVLGKQNLIVNLKTGDTDLAAERAKEARRQCDKVIGDARRAIQGGRIPDVEMAKRLAEAFAEEPEVPVEDWLEDIEREKGYAHAYELSHIVFGRKKLISDLLDERLAAEPVGKATANELRQVVGLLAEFTNRKFVEDVDREIALKFADELLNDGRWARSTVKKFIEKLKALWNFAVRRGHLDASPWTVVSIRGVEDTERRAPSQDELRALIEASEGSLRAAIRIGAMTGLRIGELLSATPGAISDDWFLQVQGTKTKAARRIVPIHSAIEGDLGVWFDSPMSRTRLTTGFRELRESLGLDTGLTYHGLRKFCYGQLVEVEPRTYLISKIMGHKTTGLMQVYAGSISKEALREVINKLPPLPDA